MTKVELEQLRDLRDEIRNLQLKIDNLKARRRGEEIVSDKVTASSREWPYTQTSITIRGINIKPLTPHQKELLRDKQSIYEKRLEECYALEVKISAYINSIEDSRTRRIFEHKYIDGLTWAEIGDRCNCDRTTAAKTVREYLRGHK